MLLHVEAADDVCVARGGVGHRALPQLGIERRNPALVAPRFGEYANLRGALGEKRSAPVDVVAEGSAQEFLDFLAVCCGIIQLNVILWNCLGVLGMGRVLLISNS